MVRYNIYGEPIPVFIHRCADGTVVECNTQDEAWALEAQACIAELRKEDRAFWARVKERRDEAAAAARAVDGGWDL